MNTPLPPTSGDNAPVSGVGVRLFAVALIIVGALDLMLSWRGSLNFGSLPVIFFTAGIAIYGVGSIMKHRAGVQASSNDLNKNGKTV